jgi:hypothetical protein
VLRSHRGRHPGAHTQGSKGAPRKPVAGRAAIWAALLGGSVALPAIRSVSSAAPCHRMTVRPRFSLLMRSAVPSSRSAARCAVAAPRTSLHACVGLSTSHSPSLASSSREWVPGMGARQMQQWRRARNTDANTRAAPGAAVSCHVGLLR